MTKIEALRAQARDLLERPSSGAELLEVALKLKQCLETALAIRLLRAARSAEPDDETIARIDAQLMLVDGGSRLSAFRVWFGYDLFISNAHVDARPYAEALSDALRRAGFKCFLDKEDAPAGSELTDTLRAGLRSSAALLFVGSPLSLDAPYVAREIAAFTLLGRPVIPLDIGGTLEDADWSQYRAEYGIADYIRTPESRDAFEVAYPSAQAVEGIRKLFKLRRRTTIRRSITIAAATLVLVAAGIAAYQRTLANRASLIGHANQVVFLGERIIDDEPAMAIALALESAIFAEVPAAATLVRRAARLLPERQRIPVRPVPEEPELKVLVDLKPLADLSLAAGGTVLLTQDADRLSAWDIASGNVTTHLGGEGKRVSEFSTFGDASDRVLIRFDGGVLEEWRIGLGSELVLEREWPGLYEGFATLDGEAVVLAWQKGGHLVIGGSDGARTLPIPGEVRTASIGEGAGSAAILLEDGQVGCLKFKDSTWLPGPTVQLGQQRAELTFIEPLDALIIVAKSSEKDQSDIRVVVLDLKKGSLVETRTKSDRELAVDRAGGKMAWLSTHEVEQFEIWRDSPNADLVVRPSAPASNWAIEPMESDTGEPQQILYGPFGEYLVTLNAPIMQLVGAFPGNLKLWYANGFMDMRAGDPHRGLRLASRAQAVLNATFDRTGSRLAAFFEDGTVRVWDVLPEKLVSLSGKAGDVFQHIYHLGLPARTLLQIPEAETSRILNMTQEAYKVRLPEEVRHEIAASVKAGVSLAPLEQKLRREAISTAAIQSGGGRSEEKRWPRAGGKMAAESLAHLAEDVVRGIEQGQVPDEESLRIALLRLVARQPVLLAGLESAMAIRDVSSAEDRVRARACVLLALSGDASFRLTLDQAIRDSENLAITASVCSWASAFLQRNGRDLSIDGPLSGGPGAVRMPLVSLPTSWLFYAWSHGLIPCQEAIDPKDGSEHVLVPPGLLADQARSAWPAAVCAALAEDDIEYICTAVRTLAAPSFATLGLCGAAAQPDGYGGLLNIATLLRDKKRYATALAWARELLNAKTDAKHAGSAENFYGYVLHLVGKNEEALRHFARAIEQGRPDGWSERNMAAALSALGRNDEASLYYENAIKKIKALVANATNHPRGQEILRQLGEEIGSFYDAYAWHLVTKPHAKHSDGTKAIELALVAVRYTDEYHADFLNTLAHAFALAGNPCEAAKVEDRAVKVATAGSADTSNYLERQKQWSMACTHAE